MRCGYRQDSAAWLGLGQVLAVTAWFRVRLTGPARGWPGIPRSRGHHHDGAWRAAQAVPDDRAERDRGPGRTADPRVATAQHEHLGTLGAVQQDVDWQALGGFEQAGRRRCGPSAACTAIVTAVSAGTGRSSPWVSPGGAYGAGSGGPGGYPGWAGCPIARSCPAAGTGGPLVGSTRGACSAGSTVVAAGKAGLLLGASLRHLQS